MKSFFAVTFCCGGGTVSVVVCVCVLFHSADLLWLPSPVIPPNILLALDLAKNDGELPFCCRREEVLEKLPSLGPSEDDNSNMVQDPGGGFREWEGWLGSKDAGSWGWGGAGLLKKADEKGEGLGESSEQFP